VYSSDLGIVLVVGCGHQTIERIIERVRLLFDIPIYAVIGGLHLPGGGGRMKIVPIDIQPIVGTDRYPWNKLDESDTENTINTIKDLNPALVALSPHDSSDYTLKRFQEEFGPCYKTIKVGSPINI
jgi:7,8-dihydropterin-6-yl-methyl-4-(beta-D-ribofuranosyl)aminobenzene 5'-phosphate synthase